MRVASVSVVSVVSVAAVAAVAVAVGPQVSGNKWFRVATAAAPSKATQQ